MYNVTLLTWITLTFISSDCGSAHIYETPVLMYSSDVFTTGSSGSTSFSSRSVESDLTSSTEVDSGYSSSVDIRRFNLLNGENSPEQQTANFGALYENINIRKPTAYELMSPAIGPVSSPIPIPKQGTGEPRYSREQCDTLSTPPMVNQKCPLDFSNFRNPQLSGCKTESPPIPVNNSSSLPIRLVAHQDSTRLSKTVSPPASKKYPLDSGIGETFPQEMLTFVKRVGVDKSASEEEDIYEDLSMPFVAVPENSSDTGAKTLSSRDSLKAHNEHSYENHCIPVKQQSIKKREPQKDVNHHHDVPDDEFDRIRCHSAYQLQNDHQLRDARSNTWPTQQNYDNHKLLKDADAASSSGACCYDNHKLRPSDTKVASSDECYDNWKIKNETCNSADASHEVNERLGKKQTSQTHTPCYENVDLHSNNVGQSHENSILKSTQTSYENFTPKVLQNGSVESEHNHINDSVYENCEIVDKKKEISEKEAMGISIPRCNDQNDSNPRKLSHSLPTNCHCVDVVPDEQHGFKKMILEKRSPPALTRVGSADAITVDEDTGDRLSFRLTADSGDNLHFQNHPTPPPRWKRIARMKRTQSLVGCSQQRWEMAVSPELATALSNRWNGTAVDAAEKSNQETNMVSDPRLEAPYTEKRALPPRANRNSVITTKHTNTSSNTYENVILPRKLSTEETCPPKLPPKLRRSINGNSAFKNTSPRAISLQYENVDGVNGFHVVGDQNGEPELGNDSPPPLPRKLSRNKVPPVIPCRVDLEQTC